MNHGLADKIDIRLLTLDGSLYALTAGTDGSFSNGTEVSMGTFKNVMFVLALGAVSASGVLTMRAKCSDTTATYGSGTVDQIGSDLTNSAAGEGDNKVMVLDFHNIKKAFARLSIQRTGGNVVVLSCMAILYNGPNKPAYGDVIDAMAQYSEPVPSTT